jgi:hypothetical protein
MKKPLTTRTYVSPFIRMKATYIDWTGYDATLIEEACEKGLELEELVKQFRDFSPREARQRFWTHWGTFGGIFAFLALIGLFVLFGLAIANSGYYDKGFKEGRQTAVASAIAFVEAKYRHVDPSQIRLEFPNGTEIFTLKDYVISKGYSPEYEDNMKKYANEYNTLIANGGAYTIFITPVGPLGPAK